MRQLILAKKIYKIEQKETNKKLIGKLNYSNIKIIINEQLNAEIILN